jgi:hypothetical protein
MNRRDSGWSNQKINPKLIPRVKDKDQAHYSAKKPGLVEE